MVAVVIGKDIQTGQAVTLGGMEHRSGLYVLGKPGMGKSTLLVNLINQAIQGRHAVFFLDPHGEAIADLLKRSPVVPNWMETESIRLLNPTDDVYSFGINPLSCANPSSLTLRMRSYNKTYDIFHKLWEKEWGVWLQLVIENTLPVFIENQEYTLAEIPLFLTDASFRNYLLKNVQHNTGVLDFWQYEFKPEQAQAALTRVRSLLSNQYVRDIVGQHKTTFAFDKYVGWGFLTALYLPTTLSLDARKFIGTVFLSELFHAIRERTEEVKKNTFYLYVDEFQHFATDQFADFILEGRKWGCATTIAHQERVGQFGENDKILGATSACANKVFFQITPKDAREFATEFAEKPTTTETRWIAELVIAKDPFWDLMRRGHANPRVQDIAFKYLRLFQKNLNLMREFMEKEYLIRMSFQDEATLSRDQASLYGLDEREEGIRGRGRDVLNSQVALIKMESALQDAMHARGLAKEQVHKLELLFSQIQDLRYTISKIEEGLTLLMEGKLMPIPGQEAFAELLFWMMNNNIFVMKVEDDPVRIEELYIYLLYGDPKQSRIIPGNLALKYWPKQVEEIYVRKYLERYEKGEIERKASHKKGGFEPGDQYYIDEKKSSLSKAVAELHAGQSVYEFTEYAQRRLNAPRYSITKITPPDLPSRFFTEQERRDVIRICKNELLSRKVLADPPFDYYVNHFAGMESSIFFTMLDELIELCVLLTDPDNHIKVPSGQYVQKQVNVRSVQDMTNEMAQELGDLPRFHAYAKIMKEENGEQHTMKQKIKTEPLPEIDAKRDYQALEARIIATTREKCCKLRSEIAKELRQRQEKWRGEKPEKPSPPTAF